MMKHLLRASVVLTLAAAPIAAAAQTSTPAGVVRSAYACIFSRSCPESTARSYLTPSFAKDFAAVDALEKRCRCEVIDASPWIDAQAGPDTFSLGTARIAGNRASVPIHFSGGKSGAYSLTIAVERAVSGWAISDIMMRDGASTAAMMAANVARAQQADTTPDGVLHSFERWHNEAAMHGSLSKSFDEAKPYLTPAFARDVKARLAQQTDPFTLSAARVTDWETGRAKVDGDRATATVQLQFQGGARAELRYRLERIGGHWAISGITSH